MPRSSLKLRRATIHDADLLLEWRNDPQTKKGSHNINEIQRDEHISWLTKIIKNTNRRLLIAEYNGVPVGTIRVDHSDGGAHELSWTVAPNARGKGLGKRMVALLANSIAEPIRAEVKAGNKASICIAEYAGMKYDREENGVLFYSRAVL